MTLNGQFHMPLWASPDDLRHPFRNDEYEVGRHSPQLACSEVRLVSAVPHGIWTGR